VLIGLVVGAVIGAAWWGWPGALAVGFVGWLVGVIVQSSRKAKAPVKLGSTSSPSSSGTQLLTYEARIARLEETVAALQAQLAALGSSAPSPLGEGWGGGESAELPPVPAPAVDESPLSEPPPLVAPPPSPPPLPPAPATPSLFDRLLQGNLVAKLGVVILFFGMAFLLKFAYDRGLFPPVARLIAVAAAAVVLFGIGRWLLARHRAYAVVLMGGGMGLAYLDVFFALKTFEYIGPTTAFTLFAILGIATLLLAVRLDARAFAALGLLGGFLAPILASSGSGQHVILFSYYLVLNVVIFATSWFRSWRELNFIGFLFTFAIAAFWGHENYRRAYFDTVEPFLVAFWVLYVAIPILFSHRQPAKLRGIVDGTLVFGTPLCAMVLQAALTRGMPDMVLGWTAAVAALVYGALAFALWRRPNMRVLAEAHLALAVVFGTLAPYFAWGGYPTFAFWTIEGAAIHWIGCRQRSRYARVFAEALQLIGAAYFMWVTRDYHSPNAVLNEIVVGCTIIAVAALVTARSIAVHGEVLVDRERKLEQPAVVWSMLWLLAAAWYAIGHGLDGRLNHHAALLGAIAVMELACEGAGTALAWRALRRGNLVPRVVLAALAVLWFDERRNPLEGWMWAGWAGAVAAGYFALRRQEWNDVAWKAGAQLVVLGWVVIAILAHAAHIIPEQRNWGPAWSLGLPGLVFAGALAAFVADWRRKRWPVAAHAEALRAGICIPLLVIAALWTLFVNVDCDGDSRPWTYLPILNPLDIAQVALLAAAAWAGMRGGPVEQGMKVLPATAVAAFIWVNGALLRTIHQWTDVPYDFEPMMRSVVAQSALSLLWTVTALVLMFFAGRRRSRPIWMVGAGLLGIVVLKLFANDLGNAGTVARIVSFIGVGVLMLLIGFLSPVPPREPVEVEPAA
jgi:uncharacterized membrane protein